MNRRTFIKGILGAAAAVAVPVKLVAAAEKAPISIRNGSVIGRMFDNRGIKASRVKARIDELTKATKKAAAAFDGLRRQMGEAIAADGSRQVSERFQELLIECPEMSRPAAYMQAVMETVGYY